jgi:membrane fusion protein (multidrug efflux system)
MANEPTIKPELSSDSGQNTLSNGYARQNADKNEDDGGEKKMDARHIFGTIVAVALVIAGLVYGVRYYQFSQTHVTTDDAYITGNLVNVSPIISGTLSTLTVDEGDNVSKGMLIARLDDSGPKAAVDQATQAYHAALSQIPQAELSLDFQKAITRAAIRKSEQAIKTQGAKTNGAQAQVALTQATVQEQVKQAEEQVAAAMAQAAQAEAQVLTLKAGVNSAKQAVVTAERAYGAAQANVKAAAANADRATRDERRYNNLQQSQAVTRQQYDAAKAAADSANSQLEASREQADQAKSAAEQARDAVIQTQAQVNAATKTVIAANRQVDIARAALAIARANLTQVGIQQSNLLSNQIQIGQAQSDLSTSIAGNQQIDIKRKAIETLKDQAAQAKAILDNAQVTLDDTKIYAPSDGTVVKKAVNPGAALTPGQTIVTMTSGHDVWVTANFKETQLRDVRVGQLAEVEVDTFPGRLFKGRVVSINEATGASTALLPPDNATGNFTKVVQRIPLKIVLSAAKPGDPGRYATQRDIDNLRQGMSVTATIDTSKSR